MPNQLSRVQVLIDKYTSSLGLPFQKLLPESFLADAIDEEKIKDRHRIFSPIVTIWAFLSQVLDTDKSCHNAVSRIIAWLAGEGLEIPLSNYLNPGDIALGDRAFCAYSELYFLQKQ